MARGGPRSPGSARKPPSGPGKFSQRSDAQQRPTQPVRTPGLGGPDIQYGDVGMLQRAQQTAPLPNAPSQQGVAHLGSPLQVPGHVFESPSTRPDEPISSGMPFGPGPGPEALQSQPATPDVREQVLMYLVQTYDNQDAAQMLADIRQFAQGYTAPSAGPATPAPAAAPGESSMQPPTDAGANLDQPFEGQDQLP